jgi:ribosomal protein S27E
MVEPLRILGSIVVTIRAGRCGKCGAARIIFINHNGSTKCAGCADLSPTTTTNRSNHV